jgi:hypothetical protein
MILLDLVTGCPMKWTTESPRNVRAWESWGSELEIPDSRSNTKYVRTYSRPRESAEEARSRPIEGVRVNIDRDILSGARDVHVASDRADSQVPTIEVNAEVGRGGYLYRCAEVVVRCVVHRHIGAGAIAAKVNVRLAATLVHGDANTARG